MSASYGNGANAPEEEEDDDYMNMTFDDPTPKQETSLQRTQRLKAESRARGVIKSKAERAEEEAAAREKALSTSLLEDPKAKKSKGLAMMAKMGFAGGGLGRKGEDGTTIGRAEPIKVDVKEDRGGIGMDNERKRKLQEAVAERDIKTVKMDPDEYRDRVRKEREDARLEKQLHAAQRMTELLDEEKSAAPNDEDDTKPKVTPMSARPLKSISVLYRGLTRHRLEQERDRRMRHDLELSLSRLPTYEDEDEDEDDKKALGKKQTTYTEIEDLDEEDTELEDFNSLDVGERLRQLLEYLRSQHLYCFWCKTAYPDSEMDGCPGLTEEDHD
ncbi:uncharacterized protein J7T54_008247 [Emericellopsis cladophorae]|uniref:G-patch domain-containing protein n=1 Tax=Emericellopsis cladophorae TaxID=2686198 RepID=A0A9Q0BCZ0_9HYPO|nr:uncharacterized protein J7T54_008247 [Emericellopsis cladophorae]KAI6779629.1 hypothetical protein J7T54_008247 [Emericellopsis cladophorae]